MEMNSVIGNDPKEVLLTEDIKISVQDGKHNLKDIKLNHSCVGILKGSAIFMSDLIKRLIALSIDLVDVF